MFPRIIISCAVGCITHLLGVIGFQVECGDNSLCGITVVILLLIQSLIVELFCPFRLPAMTTASDIDLLTDDEAQLLTSLVSAGSEKTLLQKALVTIGNKAAFTSNQVRC